MAVFAVTIVAANLFSKNNSCVQVVVEPSSDPLLVTVHWASAQEPSSDTVWVTVRRASVRELLVPPVLLAVGWADAAGVGNALIVFPLSSNICRCFC